MATKTRSRGSQVTLMLLVPVAVVLLTVPALLIVPPGHEGTEGGPVDHNWGGHAWSHANVAWFLGVMAVVFYLRAGRPTLVQAFAGNRFGFLAWAAVVWGAAGFTVDGVLTAMVGDDTTWTHEAALQMALQFPFMIGILVFGIPALVREIRRPKGQRAPGLPA